MKSVCNFRYAGSKTGSTSFPNVKNFFKYLQHRNDREDHITPGGGRDRWVDGGLGGRYQDILKRLDELSPANRHVYCFSVVVSPDPEELGGLEEDPQARFVEALKASLAEWDRWRQESGDRPQAGPIEYSFVVHRPVRDYGEQMHAHLILPPATQHALSGDMTPLYNNQAEVAAFKEIVYRQLDRAYDLEREQDVPGRDIEFEPLPAERGLDLTAGGGR